MDILRQLRDLFDNNERFQRQLESYARAMDTLDFKFMQDAMMMIRGQMAIDLLSRSHTLKDKEEKDVIQRTYYNINLMLEFLGEPKKWIKKRSKRKVMADLLKGKAKAEQRQGGK